MKIILELLPLAIFFICFKFFDLFYATSGMMVSALLCTWIYYKSYGNVPKQNMISLIMMCGFGAITLITRNTEFIKIKLTLLNLLFAIILIVGVYYKKLFLKYMMGGSINLSNKNWEKFSIRWAVFFLITAIANEYCRRNFSDEVWVNFKVFGILPLSLLFLGSQVPFIIKNSIKNET